jgi:hypothetical protein
MPVWKKWKPVGIAVIVIGAATFFGGILLALEYDKTRPTEPVYEEGRTHQLDNHGHVVFLTENEHLLVDSLLIGGWLVAVGGSAIYTYSKRLNKRFQKDT